MIVPRRGSHTPQLNETTCVSQQILDFSCRLHIQDVNPPSPFSHSTNTRAEELGTEVSNSRAVRLMQWDFF